MRLFRKLHGRVAPPGLEWKLLKAVPSAILLSLALPAAIAFGGRVYSASTTVENPAKFVMSIDIFAWSIAATLVTAVITVAIGCIVVWVMKGPAYVADSYPLPHASRPDADAGDEG